jgi:hypothetical protein
MLLVLCPEASRTTSVLNSNMNSTTIDTTISQNGIVMPWKPIFGSAGMYFASILLKHPRRRLFDFNRQSTDPFASLGFYKFSVVREYSEWALRADGRFGGTRI